MEIQKPSRRRRHHPEEFKQAVIEACCEPGASVAGIAMANGVNANQVRRWMRERAHRVGGECRITSKIGEGTRVKLTLPKESREAV